MKRALVLVEGQTEERFVKDVLSPHLRAVELYITPTILATKRLKDGTKFRGGVSTYAKFRGDVMRLVQGSGGALVTSMLDYYGLPSDFPGMSSRPPGTAQTRAAHVENAIYQDVAVSNFTPFLMVHEFEALLFSDPVILPAVLVAERRPAAVAFAALCGACVNPEEINEGPNTAPSKRLVAFFPEFRKLLHGPTAAGRIGLNIIRGRCPRFSGWIDFLERYATAL